MRTEKRNRHWAPTTAWSSEGKKKERVKKTSSREHHEKNDDDDARDKMYRTFVFLFSFVCTKQKGEGSPDLLRSNYWIYFLFLATLRKIMHFWVVKKKCTKETVKSWNLSKIQLRKDCFTFISSNLESKIWFKKICPFKNVHNNNNISYNNNNNTWKISSAGVFNGRTRDPVSNKWRKEDDQIFR